MADNISVTQGYGTTMATDDIGGVHYPRTKLVFGADGSQSDVSTSNRLPVDVSASLVSALAKEQTLQEVSDKIDPLATEATLSSIGSKLDPLATEDTLASADSTLTSIDGKIDLLATEDTLAGVEAKIDLLATEATLTSVEAKIATEDTLASIDGKISGFATEATLQNVEAKLSAPTPAVARQLAAGASSANTTLTSAVRRVSIYASGANIRYSVGAGAQTASATSHYIAQGERLSIGVPAGAQIAVIRANATDGTLELSELS